MPTEASLQGMLARWKRYSAGEPRPTKEEDGVLRQWWDLFGYLEEVRGWTPQDRVDPNVAAFARRERQRRVDGRVAIELNAWFRGAASARAAAEDELYDLVEGLGGAVLDTVVIEEIQYHGFLIELPGDAAERLGNYEGPLATAQTVQKARPQSIARVRLPDEPEEPTAAEGPESPLPEGEPLVALLDGYPVAAHELLRDRLDIEEVDVSASDAPVDQRYHGTSMASLIVHGDLHYDEPALARPLKVVPVMVCPDDDGVEITPPEMLPIGVVYRAVIALVEGLDGGDPLAPQVVVINHSLCDAEGLLRSNASDWARLLDHLSVKHRLLFVVSAGNITTPLRISEFDTAAEFRAADPLEQSAAVLNSLERAKATRGLLNPAESMNALTVGAVHIDGFGSTPAGHFDPFPGLGMTNHCSALGFGLRKSVKPDLIEAGGRQLVSIAEDDDGVFGYVVDTGIAGQLSASPDPYGGSSSGTRMSSGTSNAAALTSRAAGLLGEMLVDEFAAEGRDFLAEPCRAAILKSLLIHSSAWGPIGERLEAAFPPPGVRRWRRRRSGISQFLGFGQPDHSRVTTGQSNRATMIAYDRIGADELHEYRIPVPASLLRNREIRRLTLTLSWMTPVRPTRDYREIALDLVDRAGQRKFWKGVGSSTILQPDADGMRRGTVIHTVLEGTKLMSQAEPGGIFLGVQARSLYAQERVQPAPYALTVTIELAQNVRANIYSEVRTALALRQPAR
jgi:hypothetical protein